MKQIEDLLEKNDKYKDAILQQKLKSKKNTVIYVTFGNKPRVLKCFVPGNKKRMENEYNILKKGENKLNIPNVFEMDEENNVLILNYIIGENVCDILNDEDTSFDEKNRLMMLLAEWFYDFHTFFKQDDDFLIHGDPTIRNFVFTDRIWGVDFEESRNGKPVEDIAGVCASILTTDPMFTSEKNKICRLFIKNYVELAPGRIKKIDDEIAFKILEKIQYRPKQEETLRKHSKKIREKGL